MLALKAYESISRFLDVLLMQTLYESSIAFGMRKALQTEQGKGDMEGRIGTLEAETKDFERQVMQHTCVPTVQIVVRAACWL